MECKAFHGFAWFRMVSDAMNPGFSWFFDVRHGCLCWLAGMAWKATSKASRCPGAMTVQLHSCSSLVAPRYIWLKLSLKAILTLAYLGFKIDQLLSTSDGVAPGHPWCLLSTLTCKSSCCWASPLQRKWAPDS